MAGMIDTGRQFDDDTLALLRSCIGRELVEYTAYCPFRERNIYAVARLAFGSAQVYGNPGTLALDISNRHESIVLGPESVEEDLAIMRVEATPADAPELWHPHGTELATCVLGLKVNDVLVVVDTMLLSKGSRQLNKLVLVQAVAFESVDADGKVRIVAFDRDAWSDEYLNVCEGGKISEVTRDMRSDYVAEPPYSYRFGRNIVRLSNRR